MTEGAKGGGPRKPAKGKQATRQGVRNVREALSKAETREAAAAALREAPVVTRPDGDGGAPPQGQAADAKGAGSTRPRRSAGRADVPSSRNFELRRDGVFRRVSEDSWVKVCSPLEVLASTRDDDNEEWGRLVEVIDEDGVKHQWAMPAEMLAGSGEEFRRRLLGVGLRIEPGDAARKALHEYLSQPVKGRARCVPRIGWHHGRFVLPDEVLGPDTGGERLILQTSERIDAAFRRAGDLASWKAEVATPAIGNSRVMFAISASLAGPLLSLLDREGGGLHWRGGSSLGKTTVLRVAASVWGLGIKTWRTTDNSLETTAVAHSDTFLALDELAQIEPKAAAAAAYMLAQGQGKARMGRDSAARRALSWRINFQSTGEIGLADKIREGGGREAAGMAVRVIDLPADAGAGMGLFEELHGEKSSGVFAERLKTAAGAHYGTAGRRFVQAIADDLDGTRRNLAASVATIVATLAPSEADGQVRRVAERFALIAAAGELARAHDVTPWPEGAAIEAAQRLFADWMKGRGGSGAAEVIQAIANLRQFLESHGNARFEAWYKGQPEHHRNMTMYRAGFVKRAIPTADSDEWGPREYYLFPSALKEALGVDHRNVIHALIVRGVFIPGSDGKASCAVAPQTQGKTMRLYHVAPDFLSRPDGDE